jgi:hypothetical protein
VPTGEGKGASARDHRNEHGEVEEGRCSTRTRSANAQDAVRDIDLAHASLRVGRAPGGERGHSSPFDARNHIGPRPDLWGSRRSGR